MHSLIVNIANELVIDKIFHAKFLHVANTYSDTIALFPPTKLTLTVVQHPGRKPIFFQIFTERIRLHK